MGGAEKICRTRERGQPGARTKDQSQLEGNSCGPNQKSTVANPRRKHLKDRD